MADALTIVLLPPRAQPTAAALKIKLPPSWRAKRIGRLKEKLVAQRDRTHATALTGARLKLGRTLLDDDAAVGSLFAREAEPCLSLEGDALRYPASLAAGAVARVPVADDARVLAALRSGTPVVITGGCGLARPLVDAGWSIDDMAERGSASLTGSGAAVAATTVVDGNALGGTFALQTADGYTTDQLPYDVSTGALEAALEAPRASAPSRSRRAGSSTSRPSTARPT